MILGVILWCLSMRLFPSKRRTLSYAVIFFLGWQVIEFAMDYYEAYVQVLNPDNSVIGLRLLLVMMLFTGILLAVKRGVWNSILVTVAASLGMMYSYVCIAEHVHMLRSHTVEYAQYSPSVYWMWVMVFCWALVLAAGFNNHGLKLPGVLASDLNDSADKRPPILHQNMVSSGTTLD